MAVFYFSTFLIYSLLTKATWSIASAVTPDINGTVPGVIGSNQTCSPVATVCGPPTANIVCIDRYGSYLPPSFSRNSDPAVGYTGTLVPNDPSWNLTTTADFIVFDRERGLELLGLELVQVFEISSSNHLKGRRTT